MIDVWQRKLDLVTVETAAVKLRVPPWCFYKWINKENMPCAYAERFSPSMRVAVVNIALVRRWLLRHHKDSWIGFGQRKLKGKA